ncbi:MAG: hypothetical protein JST81_00425 [Bacteroidetes bacterium]|nr:hypothetical protein [Bacteroidota bacterium]
MERKINLEDASLFRIQAMLEQLLRLHCEMYAHMAKKDFEEIYGLVWKEVDSSTKELIKLHSNLGGDPKEN